MNRPESTFDADIVFAAAARFDKAIEINSRPERLDPPKRLLRLAIEAGCRVSIDSDAHDARPAGGAHDRLRARAPVRRDAADDRQRHAGRRAARLDRVARGPELARDLHRSRPQHRAPASMEVSRMPVAKVTELSCTSTESFEDAIRQGIERATKTLRGVRSAWIKEQRQRQARRLARVPGQHPGDLRPRGLSRCERRRAAPRRYSARPMRPSLRVNRDR